MYKHKIQRQKGLSLVLVLKIFGIEDCCREKLFKAIVGISAIVIDITL